MGKFLFSFTYKGDERVPIEEIPWGSREQVLVKGEGLHQPGTLGRKLGDVVKGYGRDQGRLEFDGGTGMADGMSRSCTGVLTMALPGVGGGRSPLGIRRDRAG